MEPWMCWIRLLNNLASSNISCEEHLAPDSYLDRDGRKDFKRIDLWLFKRKSNSRLSLFC